MDNCTSWYTVKRLLSACTCFCTFECTVWRACKAPSRVQWYSKLHPLVFSVFFLLFLLPAAYTTPSKRETKKRMPLYTIPGCTIIHLMQMSDSVPFGVMYECICLRFEFYILWRRVVVVVSLVFIVAFCSIGHMIYHNR